MRKFRIECTPTKTLTQWPVVMGAALAMDPCLCAGDLSACRPASRCERPFRCIPVIRQSLCYYSASVWRTQEEFDCIAWVEMTRSFSTFPAPTLTFPRVTICLWASHRHAPAMGDTEHPNDWFEHVTWMAFFRLFDHVDIMALIL